MNGLGAAILAMRNADQSTRLDTLQRILSSRSRVDASQDEQLNALWAENEQLRLCLAMLIGVLIDKGVMTADEAGGLFPMTDPPQRPVSEGDVLGRVVDDEPQGLDESPELEQIEEAVEEHEQERQDGRP